MDGLLTFFLDQTNVGLMLGLSLGLLLLLRPALVRLLSPQQRAVVWMGGWLFAWVNWSNDLSTILPVTFQDLVVPRTGDCFSSGPAFLPSTYEGAGPYNLALPGGALLRVTLTDSLLVGLLVLWVVGMAAVLLLFFLRSRKLLSTARQGRLLEEGDPLLAGINWKDNTTVRMCRGLPASFVRYALSGYEIYLQEELPPERLRLVLLHESRHIALFHTTWKTVAVICLVRFWWNPLVWLAFRHFSRDLELACDASVLKRLEPGERKEYAKALLELGSGRQLWEAPLSFGECDGAVRVKAAVRWRPSRWWKTALTWGAAAFLALFLLGGSWVNYPAQDLMLAWEREGGGTAAFLEELNHQMAWKLGLTTYGAEENIPDLGITGVWEAPDWSFRFEEGKETPLSALWVETESGWYYVRYGWWGTGTGTFGILGNLKKTESPDLRGRERLA